MMSEAEKSKFDLFLERYVEVSESQEFEYNASDWSALEVRMDMERRNQRMITIVMISSIICTFLLSWNLAQSTDNTFSKFSATISHESENGKGNEATQEEATITNESNSSLTETSPTNKQQINPQPESPATSEEVINQVTNQNLITEIEQVNDSKTQVFPDVNANDKTIRHSLDISSSRDDGSEDTVNSKLPSEASAQAAVVDANNKADIENKKRPQIDNLPIIKRSYDSSPEFGKDELIRVPEIELIDVHTDKSLPRFVLGIHAGAEVSQTPTGDLSDTDFSIGAKFGIVASKNLALNLGVSYVRECYTTPTSDYTVPQGFWQGNVPNDIQALCDMLDVTLGASYHFNEITSKGLVAHVNFSSNSMINESYEYRFTNNDDNRTDDFSFANATLLSNIELSTTYNVMLSDKYGLDLGPYIKIPINGVGFGEVKLRSFGFRVGLNVFK